MDSKITPPLINALLRSPNTDVVRIAAKMLGNIALTPGQREFAIYEGAILKRILDLVKPNSPVRH